MTAEGFATLSAPAPMGHEMEAMPGQRHLGDLECGEMRHRVSPDGLMPGGPNGRDDVEYAARPQLRAAVLFVCAVLSIAMLRWGRQMVVLPILCFLTTGTSTIWCTPTEFIIALGPVPMCMTQRRIPYEDISSVTHVRGCCCALATILGRLLRLWQPLGFGYGLTLGKDLLDIRLQPSFTDGGSAKLRAFWPQRMLVSVDDAEGIIAHVNFRKEHGSRVVLPASFRSPAPTSSVSQWVLCDAFPQDVVVCDACDFLLMSRSRAATYEASQEVPPREDVPPVTVGKAS